VSQLLGRRRLEGGDPHHHRVQDADALPDRAVLARGVHPLEYDEKRPPAVRGQSCAVLRHALAGNRGDALGLLLIRDAEPPVGREAGEIDRFPRGDEDALAHAGTIPPSG
jgi:hypothetical protein